MNRTTEDSKKWQVFAGGQTIPLENGKIEIPPKKADRADEVVDNILNDGFTIIRLGICKAEDILSKKQIEELKVIRKERKTEKALQRREKMEQR